MKETSLAALLKEDFTLNCKETTQFTKQRGPTCGLYTIQNIQEGLGIPPLIPATKEGKKHLEEQKPKVEEKKLIEGPKSISEEKKISLRSVAKSKKLSVFGEVYDAESFVYLAKMSSLKPTKIKVTELEEFWKLIQSALTSKGFVAVPVSNQMLMNKQTGKPGDDPHWVLLIGIKPGKFPAETEVAITTWGRIWKTKIEHLFLANQLINDRPQRYKKKVAPMKYEECEASETGAVMIPEYKASVNLAKQIVILE